MRYRALKKPMGAHKGATLPSFSRRARYRSEQLALNRDLRHLERDIATVTDDLCTDLDQLLAQARQRPVRNRFRSRERAKEVSEFFDE